MAGVAAGARPMQKEARWGDESSAASATSLQSKAIGMLLRAVGTDTHLHVTNNTSTSTTMLAQLRSSPSLKRAAQNEKANSEQQKQAKSTRARKHTRLSACKKRARRRLWMGSPALQLPSRWPNGPHLSWWCSVPCHCPCRTSLDVALLRLQQRRATPPPLPPPAPSPPSPPLADANAEEESPTCAAS